MLYTVLQRLLLLVFLAVMVWSAIRPHDYFTWLLEVIVAQLVLGRVHDRQISAETGNRKPVTG
ncbi:MAG TPA: hypothetical protein VMS98_09050 [Thermoanaerobaculia bacterium]|nr:hypothetical protein [Thermoanaerobaculia bacterium]